MLIISRYSTEQFLLVLLSTTSKKVTNSLVATSAQLSSGVSLIQILGGNYIPNTLLRKPTY